MCFIWNVETVKELTASKNSKRKPTRLSKAGMDEVPLTECNSYAESGYLKDKTAVFSKEAKICRYVERFDAKSFLMFREIWCHWYTFKKREKHSSRSVSFI